MTDVIVSASDDVVVTAEAGDDVVITTEPAGVIDSPGQGPPGPAGPANALTIGTVTTGAAGSAAAATITGAPPAQTLDLTIPRGDKGDPGEKGDDGDDGPAGPANALTIGTVTTGAAGSAAAATITGAPPAQTLDLTIPRGEAGAIRNRIDNSCFYVNQRYALYNLHYNDANYVYVADRWIGWTEGSSGYSQFFTGSDYLRINRSGAAPTLAQRLQARNVADLAGGKATISIDYYSNIADTLTWRVYYSYPYDDAFGTRAAPTKVLVASGTWAVPARGGLQEYDRYIVTVDLPDNAKRGIEVQFSSSATTGVAAFRRMQIEAGSVATPWQPLSPAIDLLLCQAHFIRLAPSGSTMNLALGILLSATTSHFIVKLPATMRRDPTGLTFANLAVSLAASCAVTACPLANATTDRITLAPTHDAYPGGTLGYPVLLNIASADGYIDVSADL